MNASIEVILIRALAVHAALVRPEPTRIGGILGQALMYEKYIRDFVEKNNFDVPESQEEQDDLIVNLLTPSTQAQ